MANEKLVSVIMPAYNAEAFIENTLNSLLAQTYKNFEIVIVNDGSKDNTLEIAERLAAADSRIKVFSQENGGVSSARNTALKKATGEYITFVDSDDSLPETALADMVELMRDDVDFVVCSHNEIRFFPTPHIEKPVEYTPEEIYDKFVEFDSVVWWPWGKLLRKSVIDENNLEYDLSMYFGEDHAFNLLYAKHMKNKVVVSEKITYNYHCIRGGLCSRYDENMHKVKKYLYTKIVEFFGSSEDMPEKYKKAFAGGYMVGNMNYYTVWLPFNKAVEKVKESFEIFSDCLTDEIIKEYFTQEGLELVKAENYKDFTKLYIKRNPKATIWRKFRRNVRRFFELLQRIFLKRA